MMLTLLSEELAVEIQHRLPMGPCLTMETPTYGVVLKINIDVMIVANQSYPSRRPSNLISMSLGGNLVLLFYLRRILISVAAEELSSMTSYACDRNNGPFSGVLLIPVHNSSEFM